jgi:hypothetical protein
MLSLVSYPNPPQNYTYQNKKNAPEIRDENLRGTTLVIAFQTMRSPHAAITALAGGITSALRNQLPSPFATKIFSAKRHSRVRILIRR